MRELAGGKLDRCFNYLRHFGNLNTDALQLYEPIQAISLVRNCIVHAAGFVKDSKDDRQLREIIAKRTYLSNAHRTRLDELALKDSKPLKPYITIVEDNNAERLFIDESYAFAASGYFRKMLFDIFEQTGLASNPNESP